MYIISPKQKQYKANLHCHSTLSDGKRTPEELKKMYKAQGYSILSITDHEVPKSHADLDDEDFITVTGYEAYIRDNPDAVYDVYKSEIHLNLIAKEQSNEKYVCYNPKYSKYLSKNADISTYVRVGSEETREYSIEYINKFIKTANENGYLVTHNHPVWSFEKEDAIMQYEGIWSMEMCNYSSFLINRTEYNAALYDKLLKSGKRLFCHGSDDNHNGAPDGSPMSDSFGSFTVIMPEEFTYSSIIEAMEKGNFYASMGPTFSEISVEGNKVHVECSPVKVILIQTGSKTPKRVYAENGETICSADFEIDARANYFRISIQDEQGRFADTRGFFKDEIGF